MSGQLAAPVLLLALGAAACRDLVPAPSVPRLTARWTGVDTADFSARARAEWCAPLRLLEIRAVAGDTGVGIALYPLDTIGPGTYRVRRPDLADTAPRPSAAVGLRWFSKTTVLGFQSDSGELTLHRQPDGTLAGPFTVAAQALIGSGRLQVTGSLEALRPTSAPPTCAGRSPPDSARADSARGDSAKAHSTGDEEPGAELKD